MPGLRLTAEQARRLWSLDLGTCRSLLDALVDARFLSRSGDGKYFRMSYT
jgi:DNA-binding IclR family transcriptional regulator